MPSTAVPEADKMRSCRVANPLLDIARTTVAKYTGVAALTHIISLAFPRSGYLSSCFPHLMDLSRFSLSLVLRPVRRTMAS